MRRGGGGPGQIAPPAQLWLPGRDCPSGGTSSRAAWAPSKRPSASDLPAPLLAVPAQDQPPCDEYDDAHQAEYQLGAKTVAQYRRQLDRFDRRSRGADFGKDAEKALIKGGVVGDAIVDGREPILPDGAVPDDKARARIVGDMETLAPTHEQVTTILVVKIRTSSRRSSRKHHMMDWMVSCSLAIGSLVLGFAVRQDWGIVNALPF